MVVVWMGNHAGCELAGMAVLDSSGKQSWGNKRFGGEQCGG